MAAELLAVRRAREGCVERLTPIGELDIATVPILGRAFDAVVGDQDVRMIVMDLTELAFMDSSGLHLILEMAAACNDDDRLRIVNGSRSVERLLDVSGARDRLPIITSGDDPLAPLPPRPSRQ